MARFDFITDENFRTSLESDYLEMMNSLASECWKASHVLAGSITECILINHLISEGLMSAPQALKITFAEALKTCQTNNVITQKIADLSSVIKDYRNLIHPGRQIRLNETIDKNSADVAKALVEMVIDEIEKRRRDNYGYTAEQIVSKLKRDSSADAIIPHLLKQSNQIEIERLLLNILFSNYLETYRIFDIALLHPENPSSTDSFLLSLETCFRTAFNLGSDELKTKITKQFARIIKEEDELTVNAYRGAFFRCSDLKFASTDDIDLIKKHIFKRLSIKVSIPLLYTLNGIGSFLLKEEVYEFVNPLVRTIFSTSSSDDELPNLAYSVLDREWMRSSTEIGNYITDRLNIWIKLYEERALPEYADKLRQLVNENIPF